MQRHMLPVTLVLLLNIHCVLSQKLIYRLMVVLLKMANYDLKLKEKNASACTCTGEEGS